MMHGKKKNESIMSFPSVPSVIPGLGIDSSSFAHRFEGTSLLSIKFPLQLSSSEFFVLFIGLYEYSYVTATLY